jgi:hypothetical protein
VTTGSYWKSVCLDVLEAAKRHDYAGYSKFDALNSPFSKPFPLAIDGSGFFSLGL